VPGEEIHTERLSIRPLRAADLPAFVAYRCDPHVARYQGWETSFSMADAERLLREIAAVELGRPGGWLQLAIADRMRGTLLGDCAVRVCTEQPSTAEIGVTLARPHQGRGLAAEALDAVVTALFLDHAMHRVFAQADDRNVAVHRLLERLGFRCEARLVDADWFKGEWTTVRTYAVLREEWPPRVRSPARASG
jgi:RimJ/RimL family protein N-acetyltransferase